MERAREFGSALLFVYASIECADIFFFQNVCFYSCLIQLALMMRVETVIRTMKCRRKMQNNIQIDFQQLFSIFQFQNVNRNKSTSSLIFDFYNETSINIQKNYYRVSSIQQICAEVISIIFTYNI